MCSETLLCEFFEFCTWTAVIGIREYGDSTTRSEKTCYFNVFRVHQFDKVFHDFVYAILVEVSVISETEKIEFQALALNHFHVRDVADTDFSKVRLACNRTEACEFRAIEPYPIVVFLMLVYEGLQNFRGVIHLVFGFMTQGVQSLLFSFFIHLKYLLNVTVTPSSGAQASGDGELFDYQLDIVNAERIVRDVIVECVDAFVAFEGFHYLYRHRKDENLVAYLESDLSNEHCRQ